MTAATPLTLYTIGHSNHPPERFLTLLLQHQIKTLVDVRSVPYSHYMPHFRRAALEDLLPAIGVRYVYLGRELGGRPSGAHLLDAAGHPRYDRMADQPSFQHALDTVLALAAEASTAIMCSEEDPLQCHRRNLIGQALRDRPVTLLHIRKYGGAEPETWEAEGQLPLLDDNGRPRTVRRKPRRQPPLLPRS